MFYVHTYVIIAEQYFVSPYKGEEVGKCKLCGSQKSSKTKTTTSPVSEEDLNEIYNLMDVYCPPIYKRWTRAANTTRLNLLG